MDLLIQSINAGCNVLSQQKNVDRAGLRHGTFKTLTPFVTFGRFQLDFNMVHMILNPS